MAGNWDRQLLSAVEEEGPMVRVFRVVGRLIRGSAIARAATVIAMVGLMVTLVAVAADHPLLAMALVLVLAITGYLGVLWAQLGVSREVVSLKQHTAELIDIIKLVQEEGSTAREASLRQILEMLKAEREAAAEERRNLLSVLDETRVKLDHIFSTVNDANEKAKRNGGELISISPEQLSGVQQQLGRDVAKLQQRLTRLQWDQTRNIEALLQLFRNFEPRAPMPSSGGWALDPIGLLELLLLIKRKGPKLVVELGSGTSSVWLGYALEKINARLISFDHEATFADRTRFLLEMHHLGHVADVRLAPLKCVTISDERFDWYDPEAFTDLAAIDFLLVDGPPGRTGFVARYPALPVLEARLADQATILLDDADRPDEQEVVRRWTETVTGLTKDLDIFGRQEIFTYSRPG